MKKSSDQIDEWVKQYYHLVVQYAYYMCKDRDSAEKIANRTFTAAYKKLQKKRRLENPKKWLIETARYYILKEVYNSWERGEDIVRKYELPETVDAERVQILIAHYEEDNGKEAD